LNKKVRILHVIKSLGRGGAEMLLPETLKLHDQSRFEFHYIYFLPWKDQMVSAIEQAGGNVTCLWASNNLQIIRMAKEVIAYIRRNKIQLIHAHLPWAGIVSRFVHRQTGIPVIYTEHNKQERYHTVTKWMNKLTFNWQTAAIAVSGDVEESVKVNVHPRIPVYRIVNGVNTDTFKRDPTAGLTFRKQLGIPEHAVVAGIVAVFRFQKRLTEWLEVFKEASDQKPDLYGIIVGDGPLKNELMAHRKQLGLEQKVIMPGLQADVKPFYSVMDIFMMTSIFEGMPVALLEAMSMGCAVLTTDAGGIKEVVRNRVDGLTVPVNQYRQLSEKLSSLANDGAERNRLAQAGRSRVMEAFSLNRMVWKLEELYLNMPRWWD
jgi:glycosyltransferase involved in cell wall biosynthesis